MDPRGRRVHIKDVAEAAGVSFQTVARALNDGPKVAPETRQRVLAEARRLGYRRNAAARTLRTGRSDAIAVLAADTTRFGYSQTLHGIEQAARSHGFGVTIAVLDEVPATGAPSPAEARDGASGALQQAVDGAIVVTFEAAGVAALRALPGSFPAVALGGAPEPDRSQAVIGEGDGAADATRYLLGLGHLTVHHLAAPASGVAGDRIDGWRRALVEAGRRPPAVVEGEWSVESGRAAARALVADGATAVLCGNDDLAMGLVRGLADLGLRVPGDVSVIGFDDNPYAGMWTPALTTVRQDFVELGRLGFALLQGAIDEPGVVRHRAIAAELVHRDSTGGPRPRG